MSIFPIESLQLCVTFWLVQCVTFWLVPSVTFWLVPLRAEFTLSLH